MAEGKNSFLLYKDIIHTVRKLPKEKQAELFMTILEYVNDENPKVEDITVDLVFTPIKHSLKRDLKKYESICERNQKNGQKGGRPPKPKKPSGLIGNPTGIQKPKKADSDSDMDMDMNNSTSYTEKEFLEDWNRLRVEHLKKPSFLNSMSREEAGNFEDLKKQYSREHIQQALIGLFKQKKMPNDNSTMQSNPKHFLSYFNSYLTAYHDKNTSLYGKPELEKTM